MNICCITNYYDWTHQHQLVVLLTMAGRVLAKEEPSEAAVRRLAQWVSQVVPVVRLHPGRSPMMTSVRCVFAWL
jgi:hypothetical protein